MCFLEDIYSSEAPKRTRFLVMLTVRCCEEHDLLIQNDGGATLYIVFQWKLTQFLALLT
jgi:hypothetical protein